MLLLDVVGAATNAFGWSSPQPAVHEGSRSRLEAANFRKAMDLKDLLPRLDLDSLALPTPSPRIFYSIFN